MEFLSRRIIMPTRENDLRYYFENNQPITEIMREAVQSVVEVDVPNKNNRIYSSACLGCNIAGMLIQKEEEYRNNTRISLFLCTVQHILQRRRCLSERGDLANREPQGQLSGAAAVADCQQ